MDSWNPRTCDIHSLRRSVPGRQEHSINTDDRFRADTTQHGEEERMNGMNVNEEYLKKEMDEAHDKWNYYLQKKGNENLNKAKFYEGYYEGLYFALYTVREPQDKRIKVIADYYGYESQMDMLCEECGEFVQARNKLRRNVDGAYQNCLGEIADIAIMIEQMKLICGADRIEQIMNDKLDRQIQRIEAERE